MALGLRKYSYFCGMVLLTGATGLVGSRILFDLMLKGKGVRALKRADSDTDFVRRVFLFYNPEEGDKMWNAIDWFTCDICDTELLREAMDGISHVYHTAALVSYHPADAEKLIEVNATGTANVVNAALDCGVQKLCYISSVAALGSAKSGIPTTEDDFWTRETNTSQYGLSKFMAEREVWRGTAEGLAAVIVNPSIILGPARANQSSGQLMDILRTGSYFYPPGVTGYVDVCDVSRAAIALLESDIVNKRFVVSSENYSFRELLTHSAALFGGKRPKYPLPFWSLVAVRRGLRIRESITGKRASITPETSKSAFRTNLFSAQRIEEALDFKFTSIRETLASYRAFFD